MIKLRGCVRDDNRPVILLCINAVCLLGRLLGGVYGLTLDGPGMFTGAYGM